MSDKKGKLIVIEGLDGSGKGTQTKLLEEYLLKSGENVKKVSFPDYDSPAAAPVKMYLAGEFGKSPSDVNPYAASCFYAVDRFASFNKHWKKCYEGGTLILADRYATSNMIFQLAKLPANEWDSFLFWLEDFEYNKLNLPKPDLVIYLDMPTEVSQKLMTKRYLGDESKKDIHESNVVFLEESAKSAHYAAGKLGWFVLSCAENGEPYSIESIHEQIKSKIKETFEG